MLAVTNSIAEELASKATDMNASGDKSLEDVTDWQNEDFVYVY